MDFIGGALKIGPILVPQVWAGLEAHAVDAAKPCWFGRGCAYVLMLAAAGCCCWPLHAALLGHHGFSPRRKRLGGLERSIPKACCQWLPFSQALMAALKLITLGSLQVLVLHL